MHSAWPRKENKALSLSRLLGLLSLTIHILSPFLIFLFSSFIFLPSFLPSFISSFLLLRQGSLCNLGCPGTHSVDQADLTEICLCAAIEMCLPLPSKDWDYRCLPLPPSL